MLETLRVTVVIEMEHTHGLPFPPMFNTNLYISLKKIVIPKGNFQEAISTTKAETCFGWIDWLPGTLTINALATVGARALHFSPFLCWKCLRLAANAVALLKDQFHCGLISYGESEDSSTIPSRTFEHIVLRLLIKPYFYCLFYLFCVVCQYLYSSCHLFISILWFLVHFWICCSIDIKHRFLSIYMGL